MSEALTRERCCLTCGAMQPCELKNDINSPCLFEPTWDDMIRYIKTLRLEIERLTAERDKFEKFWKQTIEDSCEVERGIEALGIPLTDDYGALSLVEEVAKRLTQAEQREARLREALEQLISSIDDGYEIDYPAECIAAKRQAQQALSQKEKACGKE